MRALFTHFVRPQQSRGSARSEGRLGIALVAALLLCECRSPIPPLESTPLQSLRQKAPQQKAPEQSDLTTNARLQCATCHAEEAREWDESLHHASFSHPDFQASYQIEPLAFCARCHAPAASDATDRTRAALGVTCESCHAVAASHPAGVRSASAAVAKPCAACHQFAFPSGRGQMQKTADEHASSEWATTSCVTCHMPKKGSGNATHSDHHFAASRDIPALKAAVHMQLHSLPATATDAPTKVILRTAAVGHAFPTGDLNRRLRVWIWREDAQGRVLDDQEMTLQRWFSNDGVAGREAHEVHDSRIFGTRTLDFHFAPTSLATRRVIRLYYERGAQVPPCAPQPPCDYRSPPAATLFSSDLLHELVLPEPAL